MVELNIVTAFMLFAVQKVELQTTWLQHYVHVGGDNVATTLCTCRWGQKVELQTTWLQHYVHVGGDKRWNCKQHG